MYETRLQQRKVNCQISKERRDLSEKFQMCFIHNVAIFKMLEEMPMSAEFWLAETLYSLSYPVSHAEAIFDLSEASYTCIISLR